jgi:hypothetical protein
MSQLQEKRDREIAMQLQQSYENELDLNNRQAIRRDVRPEPLQQEIQPFSLRGLSGMVSKPFASEPQPYRLTEEKYNATMSEYQYPQVTGTPERQSELHPPSKFGSFFGSDNAPPAKNGVTNDSALARALQAMEFEMANETLSAREGGFRTAEDRYKNTQLQCRVTAVFRNGMLHSIEHLYSDIRAG